MKSIVKTKSLIKATDEAPIVGGWMLLEDGIIKQIGGGGASGSKGSEETPVKGEADEVIDLSEFYVLPAFIDAHTHLSIIPAEGNQLEQLRFPAGKAILRSISNIYKNLRSGVTTMRIMGQEHYIDVDIKNAVAQGLIQGPRLLVSGIGLVASNGHGVGLTVTDGVDEIRRRARQNLAKGVDFIKLFITGGM
ncbi:MAG TPA: amidohydrolase family protein, partial [Spirochaetia bacterium]|nr:amidohydrolase family protein [Spirochaetia bacterium]